MLPFLKKDKDVKIRFFFDREKSNKRMTWDDLETIEMLQEGNTSARRLKSLAARFMVDDKNNYLDQKKAEQTLGSLSSDEIADVLKQFTDALMGAAVNPQIGSGSNLPSGPGQAGTLPAGSQP